LSASAGSAVSTHRDLQREALGALVSLSAECAGEEERIDQEHRVASQNESRRHQKQVAGLGEHFNAAREAARLKHGDAIVEIERRFNASLADLKGKEAQNRQQTTDEHDRVEQDVRQKMQHQNWLAESVLEATQIQIQEEARKQRDATKLQFEALDALDKKSRQLLDTYSEQPADDEAYAAQEIAPGTAPEVIKSARQEAEEYFSALAALRAPKLFVGVTPYLVVIVLMAAAAVAAQWWYGPPLPEGAGIGQIQPQFRPIGIAVAVAVILSTGAGIFLWFLRRRQIHGIYTPLRVALETARRANEIDNEEQAHARQRKHTAAVQQRDREIRQSKEQCQPVLIRATRSRDARLQSARLEFTRRRAQIEELRNRNRAEADSGLQESLKQINKQYEQQQTEASQLHASTTRSDQASYDAARASLQEKWQRGLAEIQKPISGDPELAAGARAWSDPAWEHWQPPGKFPAVARFGQFQVNLSKITDTYPRQLKLPETFLVPALLAFPHQASLLMEHDRTGRAEAIQTLQLVMMRLLTTIPPGRARFTIIDPVALGQSFAGFMHLADFDEAIVGSRIWTDSEHIEQRLTDLTEHMETVIQKYLRNEFATIDDYNQQAGELAEPYRFLVIADLPTNFTDDAFRRLASIASSGARCGVYTLVSRDLRLQLPSGAHLDELESHSVHLRWKDGQYVWKDDVFQRFPLQLDLPPTEEILTRLVQVVGREAREAKRVEVPFESIAPQPGKLWTASATTELRVPIGRLGATRLQTLRLGRGVAQHALIAGKTGSGKSTLLHALVTNLALWYHPDEVEFYLIDFKKGVEFKTYATHRLPHARAIAVESDREFGLSVLQRLDAELTRRGEMFRKLGVQDLPGYREVSKLALPRTLLIIDEFQEFFSEDDKLAQEAGLLLDRLVRQGRAFGVHVLLGSQTIGGSSGLARSTIGQMGVRIALQTSEADSQLILGDNNAAARLLSRPGEAIYNDQGGLIEGNSPFQIAWLDDEKRERYLAQVRTQAVELENHRPQPIIFEGNAPADPHKNRLLEALLAAPSARPVPLAWLGEPVAIKDPTSIAFRRQSGANVLIIGQQEESALAMLSMSMIALAAQDPSRAVQFHVMDGSTADSPFSGALQRTVEALGAGARLVEWRAVGDTIDRIHQEMRRRHDEQSTGAPAEFLVIHGLQRYRVLRRDEDSSFAFSSSLDDAPKKPEPAKQFAEILRDGPSVGIHVMAWVDTPAAIERTLDRTSLREFDYRVLFQMSAADSSNLIDSPLANKLGPLRALSYSEEQGIVEKFRPYALPGEQMLKDVSALLTSRTPEQ
jgi:hypothetical protein